MSRGLTDPIVRRELGASVSNALVGVLLALVVGIAPTLTWLVPVVAGFAFGVAAVTDRAPGGMGLSYSVIALAALLFAGLWLTGRPILGAIPLVLFGTALGFGGNRLVFGLLLPVPESRRAHVRE
ncbi:hypothetical protein [Halapricum salinum]|uniref:Uncharacterized protein n=1 Tax=Halapricum salinum TaxID=1457250 RepID=A0A4D6HB58_9EURY|nr:hypothetical protein [Halapricum salinum]QCC50741.1 hypothetical protein DV733_05560 [Halapricum salinum]